MRNGNWLQSVLASVAALAVLIGSPMLAHAVIVPAVGSGTLVLQMDPASGVTVDGSNNVMSWTDQTGTGDGLGGDFSPASTSSAVKLVASGLNGLPAVQFTNGYLQSNFATTTAFTNITNSLTPGQTNGFTMFVVTSGATDPLGLFDAAPNAGSPFRFFGSNQISDTHGGPTGVTLGTNGTVLGFSIENDNVGTDNRAIFMVSKDEKGGPFTNFTQANGFGTGRNFNWTSPAIGAINLGSAGFFNGDVSEILIYAGVLSPGDFNAVQNSLDGVFDIPEPASMSLLMIGAGTVLLRRRRA